MSSQALHWAWSRDMGSPGRKLTLIALADAADDEGTCWPSHRHLSHKTGLARDTIRQYVRDFETEGVLVKLARERENRSSSSNEYQLQITDGGGAGAPPTGGAGAPPLHVEPPEGTNDARDGEDKLFESQSDRSRLWEAWLSKSGRSQKLDTTLKRVLDQALDARPLETCLKAIDGLMADPWWRENRPTLELRYALKGNSAKGESNAERIDKMADKADRFASRSKSARDEFYHSLSPGEQERIRLLLDRARERDSDDGYFHEVAANAIAKLHELGVETVWVDGKLTDWTYQRPEAT